MASSSKTLLNAFYRRPRTGAKRLVKDMENYENFKIHLKFEIISCLVEWGDTLYQQAEPTHLYLCDRTPQCYAVRI
jgi:hypothetical protein